MITHLYNNLLDDDNKVNKIDKVDKVDKVDVFEDKILYIINTIRTILSLNYNFNLFD